MKGSRRRKKPPAKNPAIAVVVEDGRWREEKSARRLMRRAAILAVAEMPAREAALTILLGDDARLKELNFRFRGKRKPTNVLSFPGDVSYLGDVALAYDTIAREAREQGKSFAAHAAHLAAHGVLHLLGYDHERAADARVMEALETRIVAQLGFGDPYAPKGKAA